MFRFITFLQEVQKLGKGEVCVYVCKFDAFLSVPGMNHLRVYES